MKKILMLHTVILMGGFAVGYGITSGEVEVAGDRISALVNAGSNHDVAS